MTASILLTPKFKSANACLPGDIEFWRMMLDQSDNFSYLTANADKGGPFGAQLWLVRDGNPPKYILVGDADRLEDSNAVVSKGIASAHAEAENLSPEQRLRAIQFLEAHKNKGWQIVQVSSGESCQSCRTKQVLFAEELIDKGLIERGQFHVVYKATFQQTKRDANFSDAQYDMAFRAISELGVLESDEGLFGLAAKLNANPITADLIRAGELIHVPVNLTTLRDAPQETREFLSSENPVAVVVTSDGRILGTGYDTRISSARLNLPEETAIMSALHQSARYQRDTLGIFESWNLGGARIYTNIGEIGPSYGEALWYNLSSREVVEGAKAQRINSLAREVPHLSNREAFRSAALEYNAPDSAISVRYLGDENGANFAHLLWQAKMHRESALRGQVERLKKFGSLNITLLNGSSLPVERFVQSDPRDSHYDGKQSRQPDHE